MALVIACGESSPSHIALLSCLNRTLDSIKHSIARIFVYILCCQANNARIYFQLTFEDFMKKWDENYHLSAQHPYAVFNALDAMLKDSLERLKTMRESISMAEIGFISCASKVNYMDHMGIIRVLCMDGKLGTAFWLRRKIIKKGFVPDVLTHNYLLNRLCKTDVEMGPPPNCATYNTFIKGYCLLDDVDKALYLFSTMSNIGISPNRVTCNILVHALCKRGLMENVKKVLNKILDDDYDKTPSDLITSTTLMDGYLKNGNMAQALRIWDDMVQMNTQVDVVAYNVLINGFCLSRDMNLAYEGKLEEACYIHESMSKMGVTPNDVSYKIISMVPEPLLWNCIIDCYGRSGDLSAALSVKDHMFASGVQPNVYTYNALIHAQVKGGNIDRALAFKKEMLMSGLCPDVVTYNLLIGAACKLRHILFAFRLYDEMLRIGFYPDIFTYTALIREHCLRGNMKEAEELFMKIQESGLTIDYVPYCILFKEYC
ncbi:unnamed protein product [Malus baccata var. baccata]